MCKKGNPSRIDKCMRGLIHRLNRLIDSGHKIRACCCGHGKYPMTIVIESDETYYSHFYDLISGKTIQRTRRFYQRDKQGRFYIPETVEEKT